jgi:hypothetical protein
MFHGNADSLIPIEWGENTHRALLATCGAAMDVQFVRYNGVEHELVAEELRALEEFVLSNVAPPAP